MPSLSKVSVTCNDRVNGHSLSTLVPDITTSVDSPERNNSTVHCSDPVDATTNANIDSFLRIRCDPCSTRKKRLRSSAATVPCSDPVDATNDANVDSYIRGRFDPSPARKKRAASNEASHPTIVNPPMAQGSLATKGGNLADDATQRLLFEHAEAFYSWNAFQQYIADVALVTKIPPGWFEEACAEFHKRVQFQSQQVEQNRNARITRMEKREKLKKEKTAHIEELKKKARDAKLEEEQKKKERAAKLEEELKKKARYEKYREEQEKKARDVMYGEERKKKERAAKLEEDIKKKARYAKHKEELKKKARDAKLEEELKKKKTRDAKREEEQKQKVKQWDSVYERLASHKNQTGALDVNKDDDEELFEWIKRQKSILVLYFQNKPIPISIDQARKLTSLGFSQSRPGIIRASGIVDSSSVENLWNEVLGQLSAFKERFGSMTFNHISSSHPEYQRQRRLQNWVIDQRREYKHLRLGIPSNMTAERIQKLNAIGLDMDPRAHIQNHSWEERIEQLTSFVKEHGHCKIPLKHPQLGNFCSTMRQNYKERGEGKKNALPDERLSQLIDLGFVFEAGKSPNLRSQKKMSWEERYGELFEFKEEHGHVIVPQNSGPLGIWVKEQRTHYRKMKAGHKSSMTTEKALKLSEIGFVFDASDRWNKKVKAG